LFCSLCCACAIPKSFFFTCSALFSLRMRKYKLVHMWKRRGWNRGFGDVGTCALFVCCCTEKNIYILPFKYKYMARYLLQISLTTHFGPKKSFLLVGNINLKTLFLIKNLLKISSVYWVISTVCLCVGKNSQKYFTLKFVNKQTTRTTTTTTEAIRIHREHCVFVCCLAWAMKCIKCLLG